MNKTKKTKALNIGRIVLLPGLWAFIYADAGVFAEDKIFSLESTGWPGFS